MPKNKFNFHHDDIKSNTNSNVNSPTLKNENSIETVIQKKLSISTIKQKSLDSDDTFYANTANGGGVRCVDYYENSDIAYLEHRKDSSQFDAISSNAAFSRKKSLWSRIAFKFRFIQHLLHKSRETKRNKEQQSQKISLLRSISERYPGLDDATNRIKFNQQKTKFNQKQNHNLKRTLSTKSCYSEIRRIKSESEKDSSNISDDILSLDEDSTNSYLEIYSSTHLNCPQSIKIGDEDNGYLFLINSDNETIEIFNKQDKTLTTFIDVSSPVSGTATVAAPQNTCTTPVDIIQNLNNTHFYVTDWLNDEILVYKYDSTYTTSLSTSKKDSRKYFSSPFGLCTDKLNEYLYVCNTGLDCIEIFDSRLEHYGSIGGQHNGTITGKFNSPKWITSANWGFAVSDWDSNEIKLIDRNTHNTVRTIKDCVNPESLTILDGTGTQLLVLSSNCKNVIKLYDILSGKLIKAYDYFNEKDDLCSIYGLRGLCVSNEKIYFTDCIKNRIFICNL